MKRIVLPLLLFILFSLSRPALAVTPLDVGYYAYSNAAIVYSAGWSTSADANAFGGSVIFSNSATATMTFYTLASVGRVGIMYVANTGTGNLFVFANDVQIALFSTYSPISAYHRYQEITLPAGTNKVVLAGAGSTYVILESIQLLPPAGVPVAITAVVVFPTHTPTPTLTPTLTRTPTPTNTPGPSPTPTLTPTLTLTPSATPNFVARSTVSAGGVNQDVALNYQVDAGQVMIVMMLALIFGLLSVAMARGLRRN